MMILFMGWIGDRSLIVFLRGDRRLWEIKYAIAVNIKKVLEGINL